MRDRYRTVAGGVGQSCVSNSIAVVCTHILPSFIEIGEELTKFDRFASYGCCSCPEVSVGDQCVVMGKQSDRRRRPSLKIDLQENCIFG